MTTTNHALDIVYAIYQQFPYIIFFNLFILSGGLYGSFIEIMIKLAGIFLASFLYVIHLMECLYILAIYLSMSQGEFLFASIFWTTVTLFISLKIFFFVQDQEQRSTPYRVVTKEYLFAPPCFMILITFFVFIFSMMIYGVFGFIIDELTYAIQRTMINVFGGHYQELVRAKLMSISPYMEQLFVYEPFSHILK